MAKQIVNVGATPNDRDADSIRVAFSKINQNFTELYTSLGLDEAPLNLGAFEFTGSTISTTDSSSVTIDQAVNITSDLTVGGDIVPSVAQGGDLGSAAKPWRSLYVSSSTVYFGGVPLSIDDNGNLLVNGAAIADVGTVAWANITAKPTFAAVATSGSYDDLSNKPAIPTTVSQLANDSGFITSADIAGGTLTVDVNNTGDLKGSVFGDDSTLLVDATNSKIVGPIDTASITFNDDTVQTTAYPGPPTGFLNTGANGDTGAFVLPGGNVVFQVDGVAPVAVVNGEGIDVNKITTGASAGGDNLTIVTNDGGNINIDAATTGNLSLASQSGELSIGRIGGTTDVYGEVEFNNGTTLFQSGNSVDFNCPVDFTNATVTGLSLDGDLKGSVFADDSTLLVDGVNGKLIGDVVTASITNSGDIDIASGDDVAIITSAGNNNYEWFFNSGGYLSFPQGADLQFDNTTDGITFDTQYNPDARPSARITVDTGDNQADLLLENETEVGHIKLQTGAGTWQFGSDGSLTLPGDIKSEGNINININLSDSTQRTWRFGEDGNLNLAGNLQFANGAEIRDVNGDIRLRAAPGEAAQLQCFTTDGALDAQVKAFHDIETGSYVTINTNVDAGAPEHIWTFDYNGDLTVPGDIIVGTLSVSDGIVQTELGNTLGLYAGANAAISTDDGNHEWNFGIDGTLTVAASALSGGLGMIRSPADGNIWLSGTTVDKTTNGNGVILNGGQNQGTGMAGSISLFGGQSVGGNGGNIFIDAGPGAGSTGNGIVSIGISNTRFVEIGRTGSSVRLQGTVDLTNATIAGDIRSENNINIDINLSDSTLRRWSFGEDGNLEAPGIISAAGLRTSETQIALGNDAGTTGQGGFSVAIGTGTGSTDQGGFAVALGTNAGQTNQGSFGIAIGANAGQTDQDTFTIAIGSNAGQISQASYAVALGTNAGQDSQGMNTVAIGVNAGQDSQGSFGIAIGVNAGQTNQGADAIAIGRNAATTNQAANSIVINATTGSVQNTTADSFVVKPVRSAAGTSILQYDSSTGEITHTNEIYSDQQISITVAGEDSTQKTWYFGNDGILTLPAGGDIQDSTGTSVLGGGGGGSVLEETFESKTSATGVIEHDATTNRLFRHTSISANFTANFTNLGLAANEATSLSLVLVQGATARMVTAVQIGGAAQTITWQGSASAPLGNANRTDVVTFSVLCTATDTYTVLGMLTSFGG